MYLTFCSFTIQEGEMYYEYFNSRIRCFDYSSQSGCFCFEIISNNKLTLLMSLVGIQFLCKQVLYKQQVWELNPLMQDMSLPWNRSIVTCDIFFGCKRRCCPSVCLITYLSYSYPRVLYAFQIFYAEYILILTLAILIIFKHPHRFEL